MIVRRASEHDRPRLAAMRQALWPDEDAFELAREIPSILDNPDYAVFVAEEAGALIGFAEVGERSVAEGCEGAAAYLEGIWVDAAHRRRGVARALADAATDWGRARGLAHFGSDALLANEASHAWHKAYGFDEVERLVAFARRID